MTSTSIRKLQSPDAQELDGCYLVPLDDAMGELFNNLKPHELPKVVHSLLGIALEKPIKLFCYVGDTDGTVWAKYSGPGFYASNLLIKLVKATRTLDWEHIAILLEQANSPVGDEHP